MGSIFRSEEMILSQIFLQSESAFAIVNELGELGAVQFRDLNPDVNAFQRKFVTEVRRCDEMERTLRFLNKEIEKAEVELLNPAGYPDAPRPPEMIDLENKFEQLETEMKEINANEERLRRNFLELMELKQILSKTSSIFDETGAHQIEFPEGSDESALLTEEGQLQGSGRLSFVAGIIHRERVPGFERLLWRACRGNVFLRYTEVEHEMEDPVSGDIVHKCVFIIFFQGDQLRSRVKKICEAYRGTLYPCPDSPAERREMAIGVATRIEDLKTVLGQTEDHRCRVLQTVAKSLRGWEIKVKKIKAVYHTLNLCNFDLTTKCLIGECWCPVADLESIRLAIRRGTERSGSSVPSVLNSIPTRESPPTFFRTNKLTRGFQNIVEAYGVANYREANPALFTVITFPFLFAIMFGDSGHGLIMALFAYTLIAMEKKLLKKDIGEMVGTIFAGRYVIFLMGLFSMYTGLIYNDCFSKAFNIFGSHWVVNITETEFKNNINGTSTWMLNPNQTDPLQENFHFGDPYPFGIDPIWQETVAENSITFTNSFKMKMSVIVGVSHMMFGIFLSLFNHLFFKSYISIIGEFIPQVIFLMSLFGYLCICIFYKWTLTPGLRPPSLLITMINMFLKFASPAPCDLNADESKGEIACLYNRTMQTYLQRVLVVLALLCVPWMLLTKPLYLRQKHKQHLPDYTAFPETVGYTESEEEEEVAHNDIDGGGKKSSGNDEEFQFSEVFVHQAIHTIEFCLGCISHTASYLRLWALSLAHAELSNVLWKMVLHTTLSMSGPLGIIANYLAFGFWAILTIAILLIMEGLSAFLHTLRLHWVEFQSKFYGGDGYKFSPFSFTAILENEEE
eukprot:m.306871 g.306871  ORF g.306871 m.306871 type:complete len:850 (+) comp41660_c0_seq1:92-2641(+)